MFSTVIMIISIEKKDSHTTQYFTIFPEKHINTFQCPQNLDENAQKCEHTSGGTTHKHIQNSWQKKKQLKKQKTAKSTNSTVPSMNNDDKSYLCGFR